MIFKHKDSKGPFYMNSLFQDDNPGNKLQRGIAYLQGNMPQWNKHQTTFDWSLFGLRTKSVPVPGQKEGEEVWINISY